MAAFQLCTTQGMRPVCPCWAQQSQKSPSPPFQFHQCSDI